MPADTVAVAKDMLNHLNSWPSKPCKFAIEELPNKAPAIMLQPLAGSGVERRYIDGSFIGLFTFAVYLRTEQTTRTTNCRHTTRWKSLPIGWNTAIFLS